jgi:hypothetical protein
MERIAHYVPYLLMVYGIVAFPVLMVRAFRTLHAERDRHGRFFAGSGRVLEVKKGSRPASNNELGHFTEITYYSVRCQYRFEAAGYDAWAEDTLSLPRSSPGQSIPIWIDPDSPRLFVLARPKTGFRAAAEHLPLFALPVIFLAVALVIAYLKLARS